MTRVAREVSPTDVYHVIVRGAGRRILFEDDEAREFYMNKLFGYSENKVHLLAWCLMVNHVHLLIRADLASLESLMRSLNTSFARFYNGRHGHVGPVFQDRYKSIPVKTDSQLLESIRYIHHNPQVEGTCYHREYRWSSYRPYLDGSPRLEADMVIEMFGGRDGFCAFHDDVADGQELLELSMYHGALLPKRRVISDGDAIRMAKEAYGDEFAGSIAALPKEERNEAISRLRSMGLSVRQIERLTGIGRGVIQKCSHRLDS